MNYISPNELKQLFENNTLLQYDKKHVFDSALYSYRSMKSAPFFGEETLGIYIKIFDLLVSVGYAPAAYELGLIYYNGEWWLPSNYIKSIQYHLKAAELGNSDAMFELYIYYSKAIGTDIDDTKAIYWCNKAAELNQPRACYNMGTMYANGEGVEKNMNIALQWYSKASKLGNGQASAILGLMYKFGLQVPSNINKADEYFELSVMQGFDLKNFLGAYGL